MIVGNLLQQVYNLTDTLIVGKCIGADALAAVGSAYTLMVFITSIIIGLCMGSGTFFSSDFGAGNERKLREDIVLSFWFIFSVSVAIYLIIYPGMQLILKLLQTPPELMGLMQEYVAVVFIGILFIFLYNFFFLPSSGNREFCHAAGFSDGFLCCKYCVGYLVCFRSWDGCKRRRLGYGDCPGSIGHWNRSVFPSKASVITAGQE